MTHQAGRLIAAVGTAAVLVGGGVAITAPATATPVASSARITSGDIGTMAVVNLGLTTNQAKGVQCNLDGAYGHDLVVDGNLGTASWKQMQRSLKYGHGYYDGDIDGIVGPKTIAALQTLLKEAWQYTGRIDGIAGEGTKAAFARMGTWLYQTRC